LTIVETDSTNAEVLARARQGEAEGLWVRATQQTAGRGRHGRRWESPVGNLYCSTLVRVTPADPAAATLGFVAAIALHDTLSKYAPHTAFHIKWPNDVMADGAKISGILLERSGDAVVVGIGVNVANHPTLLDRQATSIAALTGTSPDLEALLDDLAARFGAMLADWRVEGLASTLVQWQARAHPLGVTLKIGLPDGDRVAGIYGGLDAGGALKLRLADGGVRVIHAGDVFLV
jgi:BirA family transcriptional regulator, biotin operon repressor / biotin---[acetyl-CoA-carboxylase] ligase